MSRTSGPLISFKNCVINGLPFDGDFFGAHELFVALDSVGAGCALVGTRLQRAEPVAPEGRVHGAHADDEIARDMRSPFERKHAPVKDAVTEPRWGSRAENESALFKDTALIDLAVENNCVVGEFLPGYSLHDTTHSTSTCQASAVIGAIEGTPPPKKPKGGL